MEEIQKENITVGVRIRPLNEREMTQGGGTKWIAESRKTLKDQESDARFTFDMVYGPETETSEIYKEQGHAVIEKVMEGYHGCIFCYGQTGSGKTHTMYGDRKTNPGLVPISIDQIFAVIEQSKQKDYLLRCSYIEIYNESVNDLLDPSRVNLSVMEDKKKGVKIKDVTENICTCYNQVAAMLQIGDKNKNIATKFKIAHSVFLNRFRIVIEIKLPNNKVLTSTLNLIDLAGSESADVHGDQINAEKTKETKCINRSLLTLGTVIARLSDKKNTVPIPYRDSKLTRILQTALEGNSKVSIVCNISPFILANAETHSTLNFAKSAKKIKQKLVKNEIIDEKSLLTKYQSEISLLQQKLKEMEAKLNEEQHVTAEISYSSDIKELIIDKEKAELKVDCILQEKLHLEKELKMMKSFILNSDDIKPGKRLINQDFLKKEIVKGLFNKVLGKPIAKKICSIPESNIFIRQESLLTDGIDDMLKELNLENPAGGSQEKSTLNQLELNPGSSKNEKGEERVGPSLEENKEITGEEPENKYKTMIDEQNKLIQELIQTINSKDLKIKNLNESLEEKISENLLLKEEIKLHQQSAIRMNVANRFRKAKELIGNS